MSSRKAKLDSEIRHCLAAIINSEIIFSDDVLVTISAVDVSADLSQAKVYVSVLPFDKAPEIIAELVNSRQKIKQELNQKIKIRKIPNLIFIADITEESATQMENLINKL